MRFFRLQNAASALVVLGITVGLAVIQIPMSTSANAQAISTNGGSIQGTIADPTGAAIPGATVTISSSATGFLRSLVTDSAGFYSVGPLIPGNYTITEAQPAGYLDGLDAAGTVNNTGGTVSPYHKRSVKASR